MFEIHNQNYNSIVLYSEDYFSCIFNIYVEGKLTEENMKDLLQYIKCAGYIFNISQELEQQTKIVFIVTLLPDTNNNIKIMIEDIYQDFIYTLNLIKNEKKIFKHYPSIVGC